MEIILIYLVAYLIIGLYIYFKRREREEPKDPMQGTEDTIKKLVDWNKAFPKLKEDLKNNDVYIDPMEKYATKITRDN